MTNHITRRSILAAAPALACVPAMVNAAQDDPLVALAAEYHRVNELDWRGIPEEIVDQYSDYTHAITLEMLELTPTTVAGAAALLGIVHFEISEGLGWDEHPRMIETAMRFLERAN